MQGFEITRVPAPDMGFEDAVAPVIRKWRFEPARRGSLPIAAWFEGNVRFSLRPDDEEKIYSLTERAAARDEFVFLRPSHYPTSVR